MWISKIKGYHPTRIRLFESDILERLSLIHPLTPYLFWIPVILGLAFSNLAPFSLSIIWSLIGIVVWTLAEYWLHRALFHFRPQKILGKKLIYLIHGNHHDDPADPLRGVMPIPAAIIYAYGLYLLFKVFFDLFACTQFLNIFYAGFLSGYLIYDGIHYYTHHGRPKSKLGKYFKRCHLIHHKYPNRYFGISCPLWDHVFRTN